MCKSKSKSCGKRLKWGVCIKKCTYICFLWNISSVIQVDTGTFLVPSYLFNYLFDFGNLYLIKTQMKCRTDVVQQ